jgi:aerobic carbon-monoxide dehydrogenase medium subunit
MKPAPFDYVAPTDLSDAVARLAERPETTTVLAGGQSLLIDLHFRLHRPALLVDINNVPALAAITVDGDALRVGALARHRAFETPSVAPGALGRLLSRISPFIAHPPIRARGTMAGSLVFAYPGGEWCTMAVALDAAIELTGPAGRRTVAAGDFFFGPEEGPVPPGGFLFIGQKKTARQPDEILTSVRLPLLPWPDAEADAVGVGFCEQRRGHTGFAQVCAVAVLTLRNGVISGARLGLGNAADRPLRAHDAEAYLLGREPGQRVFARAAELAMAAAVPVAEPYAGVEYKRHAVGVLVRRALTQAHEDGNDQHGPRGERRAGHDDNQRTGER